ncbi:MAG: NDP-sugar synthase [Candidatus Aenigmatarchaeota archaeon]
MVSSQDIIVYVSAGGESTRLYPLTLDLTKGWLDIGNKTPLLLALRYVARQISNLKIYILTQGYANDMFIPFELRDGQPIGNKAKVQYVHFYDPSKKYDQRTTANGSGEGFINFIESYKVDKNILTMNVDNLANFNLLDMLEYHNSKNSIATIGVTQWNDEETISQFGTVRFKNDGKVTEFKEKSPEPASNYINTGIVMFSPQVIEILKGKSSELVDLGGSVIPYLLKNGYDLYVYGYENSRPIKDWVDFGTIRAYIETNGKAVLGKYDWFTYDGYEKIGEGILVHKNSVDTVKAAIKKGNLKLNGNVVIGSNPRFDGFNILENVVIGHNVIINEAVIKGREKNEILYPSILLDSSGVFGAILDTTIIGYSSKVFSNGRKSELKPFSVVGNGIHVSSVLLDEDVRVASSKYLENIVRAKRYNIVHFDNGLVFFSERNQKYNPFI